jgi:[acyl-carrier-protein] S-malonyltransferase
VAHEEAVMDPIVALCPGQGAQTVGMGKAWADKSPEAKKVFLVADRILASWGGSSLGSTVSELCFNGPAERLNQTDASQPALFVAGVACWRGLLASWGAGNGEAKIAAAAGLSLGEYTALHIAGALSFEDGLKLVALRGRAMQDAAVAQSGGMVALIGADEVQAQAVCDKAREGEVLVGANFNAPGQIVLSGHKSACDRAAAAAGQAGLRATILAVAGAFHSPLMAPAADRLAEALEKTVIRPPRAPVISNVTAKPHEAEGSHTIEATIRRRLVEQLTSPVRWAQGCQWLASNASGAYHEVAPGATLAGLMRRISRETKVSTHDQPE